MWIFKLRAVVTQAAPPSTYGRPVCQSTEKKSVGLLVYRVRVGRNSVDGLLDIRSTDYNDPS